MIIKKKIRKKMVKILTHEPIWLAGRAKMAHGEDIYV